MKFLIKYLKKKIIQKKIIMKIYQI